MQRATKILIFLLAVLFAGPVFAKASTPVKSSATPKKKKKPATRKKKPEALKPQEPAPEAFPGEVYLEETRQILSDRVLRLADSIDSLFGDKRADDKKNKSTLRVTQRFFTKDGVTGGEDIQATLNLYLPNLKQLETRMKEKFADTFDSKSDEETEPVDEAVVEQKEPNPWSLNQENGVILANPIDYFARLRLRRDFLSKTFSNSFYVQVGWSKKSEWEEVNSLTSDYALSRNLLFRFVNEVDWGMTNNSLGSVHGPSLIHQISTTEAISYDLRLSNLLEGHIIYSDRASLGSTYRRLLPNGWIFIELNPELAWERGTHFRPLYNFFVKFEFLFGSI